MPKRIKVIDPAEIKFLDSYPNFAVRRVHRSRLNTIKEWCKYHEPPYPSCGSEWVKERKKHLVSEDPEIKQTFEVRALELYNYLMRFKTKNHAKGVVRTWQAFFRVHYLPLRDMKTVMLKAIKKAEKPKRRYHLFTKEELLRMYRVGAIEEKAILILGITTGLSPIDLISLKIEDILPYLERPMSDVYVMEREKSGEDIWLIFHPDAVETLRLLIGNQTEGLLFPDLNRKDPNVIVKKMTMQANIHKRGDIVYYCLRKWHSNQLKNAGVDSDIIDALQGHVVRYNSAYLLSALQAYRDNARVISILTTANSNQRIEALTEEIDRLRRELGYLKIGQEQALLASRIETLSYLKDHASTPEQKQDLEAKMNEALLKLKELQTKKVS